MHFLMLNSCVKTTECTFKERLRLAVLKSDEAAISGKAT